MLPLHLHGDVVSRDFSPENAFFFSKLSTPFHKYTNVLGLHLHAAPWQSAGMPRTSPFAIVLRAEERRELEARAAKYTLPYFQVMRARMILHAAEGLSNDQIAHRLDTRREVVSLWRKRFFEERLAGLEERARPGRPRSFSPRTGRAG